MPAVGKRTSPRLATVRRAQARAISHGATVHPTLRVEWDAYGRCERPATVELHGRPDRIAEASRIYTKQAADQAGPDPKRAITSRGHRGSIQQRGRRGEETVIGDW